MSDIDDRLLELPDSVQRELLALEREIEEEAAARVYQAKLRAVALAEGKPIERPDAAGLRDLRRIQHAFGADRLTALASSRSAPTVCEKCGTVGEHDCAYSFDNWSKRHGREC